MKALELTSTNRSIGLTTIIFMPVRPVDFDGKARFLTISTDISARGARRFGGIPGPKSKHPFVSHSCCSLRAVGLHRLIPVRANGNFDNIAQQFTLLNGFPGAHTQGATPDPIPNSEVKPLGPMIVVRRK